MPKAKKIGAKRCDLRLSQDIVWLFEQIGGKDGRTAGVELAGKMTRLLAHAHAALKDGDDVDKAIADQIEELNIPEIYEKAQAELIEVPSANGEPAAWSV